MPSKIAILGAPTLAEYNYEIGSIHTFASEIGWEVVRVQEMGNDNGEMDGMLRCPDTGEQKRIETRRKGYPNKSGKSTSFSRGWDTPFLKTGMYLNERTIKNGGPFFFLVKIKGFKSRYADVTKERIDELMMQPYCLERSTNTGTPQSIKKVPLNWFNEWE